MTISEEHAARLKKLHETDPNFGVIGNLWASRVVSWLRDFKCRSLLDYGCGRSGLVTRVGEMYRATQLPSDCGVAFWEYDPATKPGEPMPADFVTCIDVLEHVEREHLQAVLSDLKRCTGTAGLITVSLRNAANKAVHPIVEPREWWKDILRTHFDITEVEVLDLTKAKSELAVLVRL